MVENHQNCLIFNFYTKNIVLKDFYAHLNWILMRHFWDHFQGLCTTLKLWKREFYSQQIEKIAFSLAYFEKEFRSFFVPDQVDDLTPEKYASSFSQMVFGWVRPLMWMGWQKQIFPSDLWTLKAENRCNVVVPHWDKYFSNALDKAKKEGKTFSILPVMIKSFGPAYSLSSFLSILLSVAQFANPQIVNLLIDFVSSDEPDWKGYLYTAAIVAVTFLITILNAQVRIFKPFR